MSSIALPPPPRQPFPSRDTRSSLMTDIHSKTQTHTHISPLGLGTWLAHKNAFYHKDLSSEPKEKPCMSACICNPSAVQEEAERDSSLSSAAHWQYRTEELQVH